MVKTHEKRAPNSLLESARQAAANAYAPYSEFAVGAAVQTSDGQVFTGANMENASYGLTLCAEAGALQAASTAGALDKVRKIAIVGGPIRRAPFHAAVVTPCGRCRQLIQEAAMASRTDIEVLMSDLDLKVTDHDRISHLLPKSFGAKDLPALNSWARLKKLLKRRAK